MTYKTPLAAGLLLSCSLNAFALDRKALAEHIRESYQLPSRVDIAIGDPAPSDLQGFDKVPVTMKAGPNEQKETLYLSKDGRYYTLSPFRDLKVSPDQERIAKMDIKSSAVRGKASAPVVVVEYTDFQCPFCQKGYQIMRDEVMKAYPNKVRWVYKSLPLNAIHPWAESAAVAAECALLQGQDKFWKFHDLVFDKQREIPNGPSADAKLLELAKKSGLSEKDFSACHDGKKTLPAVQRDMKEAEALGISGTPAFLINGHLVPGADADLLKSVIEEALKGRHGRV